jgi:hypothetical protein
MELVIVWDVASVNELAFSQAVKNQDCLHLKSGYTISKIQLKMLY